MLIINRFVATAITVCALGFPALSVGQDRPPSASESTAKTQGARGESKPENRKDMAQMYQKMADCLKTGKSSGDCQAQVAKQCPVLAKTGKCPLQEGLGHTMESDEMRQMHP